MITEEKRKVVELFTQGRRLYKLMQFRSEEHTSELQSLS
jgi:hypothetical protein